VLALEKASVQALWGLWKSAKDTEVLSVFVWTAEERMPLFSLCFRMRDLV